MYKREMESRVPCGREANGILKGFRRAAEKRDVEAAWNYTEYEDP